MNPEFTCTEEHFVYAAEHFVGDTIQKAVGWGLKVRCPVMEPITPITVVSGSDVVVERCTGTLLLYKEN